MKLYIWYGVLRGFSDGMVFAMAETVEQARQVVRERAMERGSSTMVGILAEATANDPEVVDGPFADWLWGGG